VSYRPPRSSDRAASRGSGRYEGRLDDDPYPPPSYRSTHVDDPRWQARPAPRPPVRRHPPRRDRQSGALVGGKIVLVVISLLVLTATGYYWSTINEWSDSITRQDVIDSTPSERPADGAIDILMVGMDSRTDAQGHPLSKDLLRELSAGKVDGTLNTDSLIMIRIPNDGGRAIGVSMPRDSYVSIPGYGTHKINSAYARAKNTAMERLRKGGQNDQAKLEVASNLEGAKSLIATIEQLTGATIDHYAEVNLLGFYDITKAIGGIEVCLNKAVNDDLSGAHLPAGKQVLEGAPALAFVRQRHGLPNGDLDRIVRQQVFMGGMAKKVFSKDLLTPGSDTLDKLRDAVQKSVVLDKDWNVIQFAQQMMGFTGGNLDFRTIPVGTIALRTPSDGDAVEVNPRDVKAFVSGLLNGGGSPTSSAPASAPSGGAGSSEGDITVDVRNASGRTGLANQVSQTLTSQGFRAGQTGNAAIRAKSVVRYAAGEQDNGEKVAGTLGGLTAELDKNLAKGHVTVLLGKDFDATAGHQLTNEAPLAISPAVRQQPNPDGCVN
jgi:LCP family protein required for cell wall assembly